MGNIYFTADPHFGHALVAELRGFSSTEEHDTAIMDSIDAAVGKDDQLWVLGDIAMSKESYALKLISTLPGEKHLISGNHDSCHPMHRGSHKAQRKFLEVFTSVQSAARRRVGGQDVLLSHFAYSDDHTEEPRYIPWRMRESSNLLLHGHTHSHLKRTSQRELHVGWDAWRRPVSLDEVATWVIYTDLPAELTPVTS